MKKILSYAAMLFAGILALTSCEKDKDWNPTLVQPTSFDLNNPAVGNGQIDLAETTGIELTWSQPKYNDMNSPMVVTYTIEVSPMNSFTKAFDVMAEDNTGADYFALDETTTSCRTNINAAAVAKGLQQLMQWADGAVPATVELAIRVKAAVKNAVSAELNPIESNVVHVTAIPYYIELSDADPAWWYLIGGDIADGKWGDNIPTSLFPLQAKKDYEFDKKTGDGELVWTGYLAGNGFKLKKAPGDWDHQWGGSADAPVENDGGSSNITMDAGYYTVTLNTGEHKLTVEPYAGTVNVYSIINISGSINDWGDTPMSPAFTFDGAENHDWYTTIDLKAGDEIKFKIEDWSANWGDAPFRKLSDGCYGYGVNNGPNIVVPDDGNYLVIFNDITGYYRLIKQ